MIPERINDYNWEAAFSFACGQPRAGCCSFATPEPILGLAVPATPFDREDVEEVIAAEDGIHDEKSWLGIFRLRDARFALVAAGCDYTGWD